MAFVLRARALARRHESGMDVSKMLGWEGNASVE
jgi:hypothetical protein